MSSALASCREHFIAAAALSLLINVLYIAPTLYMLQVYDRVVPTHGLSTLFALTLVLLFALLTLALLDRVRTRLLVRAGVALDAAAVPALLDATFGQPDASMAQSAIRDFDSLRSAVSGPIMTALFDAPWMPVYVLTCFLVHPAIGALALAAMMMLPTIAFLNERATRGRLDEAQALAVRTYAGQDAVLSAAETVRALGMRRALVARGQRQRTSMLKLQTAAGFAAGNYLTMTKFVRLAVQSLALGLGAWLATDGSISGGAIFASSFLIARALAPVEQLVGGWRGLAAARTAYHNLNVLLLEADAHVYGTQLPAPSGAVRLENITIVSSARNIALLQGVTAEIAAGEVVAIIGPSGAGKSTLVRAIAGAIQPARGCVRLDGADLASWDPERVARHIGYLPQDPSLIEGTVAENICRFATELNGDRKDIDVNVVAAADAVGATELILRLKGGFDHRLELRGRGVSAGQAQRIALARAIYGGPALVILDEPNAHLDAEGDVALNNAIAQLKKKGRTVILVSHKLGVLPVVDRIMVLREGRLELFGQRDEVLAKIAPTTVHRITPSATAAGSGARGA